MKKRNIIVCSSPLQMMNIINYVQSEAQNMENIVYVAHEFKNAQKYSDRLKELPLIDKVYDIKPFKVHAKIIHQCVAFLRYLFPLFFLKKNVLGEEKDLCLESDYMIFSIHTPLVSLLKLLNKNCKVIMIDDGAGSYTGNILKDTSSTMFKKFSKLLFQEKLEIVPEAIYLNEPDLCNTRIDAKICRLPRVLTCEKTSVAIKYVFDYKKNDELRKHRVIILDQAFFDVDQVDRVKYKKCFDLFSNSKHRDDFIVRPHPRQNGYRYEIQCQDIINLWELECIENISDAHVLIGVLSTAQFMPRILTDSEPNIIFLYRIITSWEESQRWVEIDEMAQRLKKMYRNPKKIFIPNDIIELKDILEELSVY